MGKLALLMDHSGSEVHNPSPIEASISWTARDGKAQAFNDSGKMVAELHCARIQWIEAGGIRIIGMEAMTPGDTTYRAQAWHYIP
jgi:hypothetical protein